MHIAIDARVINSGTGTYIAKLLEYLQIIDTTNTYTVLVRKKDVDYWRPTSGNFSVVVADYDNYSFGEQIGFKRLLECLHPDLVHFCMPQQPLFYSGPRVTTMHDMTLFMTYNSSKNRVVYYVKRAVGYWVFKKIAKVNRYIIAISQNTKREYQRFSHIPDSKIEVIYEAADPPSGTQTEYSLPFNKFIMYVGRQPDYKNIRRLAAAHQQLIKTQPELGLVFVGRLTEESKSNREYFNKLHYKNIHFTDYIDDNQRNWLYKQTSAYVFPSLMEGFGLPPLEAMACGAPVISSNTSCMPEILGSAAEYFTPTDTEDMARTIERVLSDDSLREAMIKRGYEQVAKYSWRTMAEQTHQVYMNALKNTGV